MERASSCSALPARQGRVRCFSVHHQGLFQAPPAQRRGLVVTAAGKRLDDLQSQCRRVLLDYVREVDTSQVHNFIETTSPSVVAAMKATVHNIVGTLPAAYFEVRISTVADSLVTLLTTVMTTGYMLRGAQSRLELSSALRSLPSNVVISGSQIPRQILPGAGGNVSHARSGGVVGHNSVQSGGVASSLAAPGSGLLDAAPPGGAHAMAAAPAPAAAGTEPVVDNNVGLPVPSVAQPACTAFVAASSEAHYAPGVQKSKVEGEVMRWHHEQGLVKLPASVYMSYLETEVAALRQQLAQQQQQEQQRLAVSGAGGSAPYSVGVGQVLGGGAALARHELLDYIKTLQETSLKELTAGANSEDVQQAMRIFIHRLMGTSDLTRLRSMTSEFKSEELAKLLFFLLVVGYTIRELEVRSELDGSMDV